MLPASPESNPIAHFPLTQHQYDYLSYFAQGHQPSTLADRLAIPRRTVNATSTAIKRKLASRTTAQAVFKAWKIGIELQPNTSATQADRPLLESLEKTPVGILKRLAGGFHSIELDQALKIGHIERIRTIRELYDRFSATTHPQLIASAIEHGFFEKNAAIVFSEQKNTKNRGRDKLTEYQSELLRLIAVGKTYKQIAYELSLSRAKSISDESVHKALSSTRAKLARLSGHSVKGPYQTAITATEIGLLPMKEYFGSLNIDPTSVTDLSPHDLKEMTQAYERVVEGGRWTGDKHKTVIRIYRSLGAENAVQAALIMHAYSKVQDRESLRSIQLHIPGQPIQIVRKSEIDAVDQLTSKDLYSLMQDLPRSGLVPGDVENKGGRIIAILASILKGTNGDYVPGTDDLTYQKLYESYKMLSRVLEQAPNIPDVGTLLRFVDQRLRKLK